MWVLPMKWNEVMIFEFLKPKMFMGLKLHQDDGKHANTLEWVECNDL